MWNDNYGNYSFYLNISDSYKDESTNKNQDIIDELKELKEAIKEQEFDG
jgi:hypothetical protein